MYIIVMCAGANMIESERWYTHGQNFAGKEGGKTKWDLQEETYFDYF